MTENLKIEVSMVDVEGGVVDTSLATKQELNEAVQSKADLIEGKVPVIQLPAFNEINGVSEAISGVETKIREEVETKLSNSNNGLESRIDEKLESKADLVNGRVPASQSPAFKDVEGAKGALDGLKDALTTKYDQKVKELSEGKADLVGGKIPANQLPTDGFVTPLDFQLKSQELDTQFSNLEDSVEAEKNTFITHAGNLIAGKANAVDVYDKGVVDNKLSGKVDVLKYEGEMAKKAEQVYVDNALTGLSNGSSKFYPTLALANADIANLAVNQPVNVGEAANGGLWYKATTGATNLTKSAFDPLSQAKNYTDLSLPILRFGNLHNPVSNVSGVYVRSDGLALVANADSIVAVIAVDPGKTYAIKSNSFNESYLAVGLKADNNAIAGQSTTKATLASTTDATVKTFSIPIGSTARFAIINIKVASSFDIRTGFVVNEGTSITSTGTVKETVQKIRGVNIVDIEAQEKLKQFESQTYLTETDLTVSKSGNLFTQSSNGFYIIIGSGKFAANADSTVGIFPVEAGKTYAIKSGNFNASYFSIMLKADNLVGSGTGTNATGMLVATSDPAVKTLTVPTDSTAKFALLNVKVASSFDIRSTLVVNEGTSITDASPYKEVVKRIKGKKVEDEEARVLIKAVDDKVVGSIVSPLKDKKWVVIGDSITEVNFRTNKNYHAYVSDNVGGMTVYNYGQSGSGYYGRFNVASTVTQDPDYVTVFFGTNDWQNSDAGNTKLLGSFGDTTNATIAGCVYLCLSQLVSKFYNKRIAVFTPLPRSDNYGSNASPNSRSFTLEQLVKVIKQTADHLSIPCLDLYHESNLPVWVYAGNQFYFTPPTGGSADGLHPNDEGHKIIARKVQNFLESI